MVHSALTLEGENKLIPTPRDNGDMVSLLYEDTKRLWFYFLCC